MSKAEQPTEEIPEVPGEEGVEEEAEVEEPFEKAVEENVEENVEEEEGEEEEEEENVEENVAEVEVKDNTEPFTRTAEDKRTWRVSCSPPLQHQR